jgi:hypothetical protein
VYRPAVAVRGAVIDRQEHDPLQGRRFAVVAQDLGAAVGPDELAVGALGAIGSRLSTAVGRPGQDLHLDPQPPDDRTGKRLGPDRLRGPVRAAACRAGAVRPVADDTDEYHVTLKRRTNDATEGGLVCTRSCCGDNRKLLNRFPSIEPWSEVSRFPVPQPSTKRASSPYRPSRLKTTRSSRRARSPLADVAFRITSRRT